MAEKGLLFIPDISGFTKFVHENEIEHSRIIIEELLENIINSNEIGLKISEVEGDAVLFIALAIRLLKKYAARWRRCFAIFKSS